MWAEIKKDELIETDRAWYATTKRSGFTMKRTSYEYSQILK